MNINTIFSLIASSTGVMIALIAVFVAIGNSKRANAIALYQPRREKLKFLIEFFGLHEILEHAKSEIFAQAITIDASTKTYPLTWRIINMLPKSRHDVHLFFGMVAKSKEFDVSFVVNRGLFNQECEGSVEKLGSTYLDFITQVSNCFGNQKDDGIEEKLDMFVNSLREFKSGILKQMVDQMTKDLPRRRD